MKDLTPIIPLQAIRDVGCDILTLGQYLSPKRNALPIRRYYTPEEFTTFKVEGERMGFKHVESGPLVRSSYHAKMQSDSLAASVARLKTSIPPSSLLQTRSG